MDDIDAVPRCGGLIAIPPSLALEISPGWRRPFLPFPLINEVRLETP